jgi:hypothetical protein
MYGKWDDDVADGRLWWETRFYLNDKLELRTVTHWEGDDDKWEMSFDRLEPREVGNYLKYRQIDAAEFWSFFDQMKELYGDSDSDTRPKDGDEGSARE